MVSESRRSSLLLDVLIIIVSFVVAHFLAKHVFHRYLLSPSQHGYYKILFITLMSWIIALLIAVEYPVRRLNRSRKDFQVALRVNILGVFIFCVAAFAMRDSFSRLFLITMFSLGTLLMLFARVMVRSTLASVRSQGYDSQTRVLIGPRCRFDEYVIRLEESSRLGFRILGWLTDESDNKELRLGSVESIREVLIEHHPDGVVIGLSASDPRLGQVIAECELQGVTIEFLLDSLATRIAHSTLVDSMGIPRLVLSQTPHTPHGTYLKRLTDIVVSSSLILVASPLMFMTALAIWMDDGGQVLFSQTRVGQNGKNFNMHKFRSMRIDAEKVRESLLHMNEMSGPVFKIANDPRVTRVGRFLRSTSLDELPQLFDVFLGRMSLVGPRPPLPSEVKLYDPRHRRRLSVKPGITCLWQISGRNHIDFEDWMNLDLTYIDNWSYLEDIKILFRTIPAVVLRRGAS